MYILGDNKMNNLNIINKIKLRLKNSKPYKNSYGTKFKNLNLDDYVMYGVLKGKRNPEKCCKRLDIFNNTLERLSYYFTYAINNYERDKNKTSRSYNITNGFVLEELMEIYNVINDYKINLASIKNV
jgi:hypothetical protein